MDAKQFDTVARALSTSGSRRGALGSVVGAVLALLGAAVPGAAKHRQHHDAKRRRVRASARKCSPTKTSNRACAQFCAAVFGADTAAASQCISAGAKCQGLCDTCGTTTAPSAVCCPRDSSGLCTDYATATCCSTGELCCGDSCVANNASHCGTCTTACTGTTPDCNGTTCVCNADTNSCGTGTECQGGSCVLCGDCGQPCCLNIFCFPDPSFTVSCTAGICRCVATPPPPPPVFGGP